MEIAFVTRSRFLSPSEVAIKTSAASLEQGGVIRITLGPGGYRGKLKVQVSSEDTAGFKTDWKGNDETRFPARIKAAATALHRCGLSGCFEIIHADGCLEIRRAWTLPGSPL